MADQPQIIIILNNKIYNEEANCNKMSFEASILPINPEIDSAPGDKKSG